MATATKRRGPIGAEYSSPGPIYHLPPLIGAKEHDPQSKFYRSPAWVFGGRSGKLYDDSSPGPAYNVNSKLLNTGRYDGFAYSIYSRPKYSDNFVTPDPGRYNYETANNRVWKSSPAYTFGLKNVSKSMDNVPGPNIYLVDSMLTKTVRSNKPSAPNYSLYSRGRIGGFSEDLTKTPGPGTYSVPEPSVFKSKMPAAVITSRNQLPSDNSVKPGPSAYYPDIKNKGPAYTFGALHSQYRGHLIVNDDLDE